MENDARYIFCIMGEYAQYPKTYYIADDVIYFVDNICKEDALNDFDKIIPNAAALMYDTTKLDFENHGTNVGFDGDDIFMYKKIDDEWHRIWHVGDYHNSDAVDLVTGLFKGYGSLYAADSTATACIKDTSKEDINASKEGAGTHGNAFNRLIEKLRNFFTKN